jgi:hypothetical protein
MPIGMPVRKPVHVPTMEQSLCGVASYNDLILICGYVGISNLTQCMESKWIKVIGGIQIPTQIGFLTNLIDWAMFNTESDTLPSTIGCLTGLTSLVIEGNNIT